MAKRTGRGAGLATLVVLVGATVVLAGCGGLVSSDARRQLETNIAKSTLTVYPVGVLRGSDLAAAPEDAVRVAEQLAASGFAKVVAAKDAPDVRTIWRRDQASMLEQVAGDVGRHVRAHPPQGEYALYAQYLLRAGERGDQVIGLQWVIVDRAGRVANAGMLDDKNSAFIAARPQDKAACGPLLANSIKRDIGGMMARAAGRRVGG